jgi:hypothetical protein
MASARRRRACSWLLGDAVAVLFVEGDAALLGLDGDDDRQGVAR